MDVSLNPQDINQSTVSELPSLVILAEEQQTIIQLEKENLLLSNAVSSHLNEVETLRDQLNRFSSRVSHDLKAPLRHISSYLTIIKEDIANKNLEEDSLMYMEIVIDASRKMGKMIDGLRELTDTAGQEVVLSEVDLDRDLSFILKQISQEYPGIEYRLAELPIIQSDLAMIRSILFQVLDNAAKFSSHKTSPVISVTCQKAGIYWEISVSDNGIGFDKEDEKMLFEIFERGSNSRDFPGQGVGLAMVRRLLKNLGGEITGKAEVGEGATFTIRVKG